MASSSFPTTYIALYFVTTVFLLSGICQGQVQRFSAEPQDAVVMKGQVHLFNCAVENQVGEVQWLRDGFGLGIGPDLEGFPRYKVLRNQNLGEHTLMVTNIQLEDDAVFHCQVGATASTPGIRSRGAKLNVFLPPDSVRIDGSPVVEVLANDTYNLTCHADKGKPAPNITWSSDGAELPENSTTSSHVVVTEDGKRENITTTLTIFPSKSDQGRSYECLAWNEAMLQRMWTRTKINVIYPPEVTMDRGPTVEVHEFDRVSFACKADANPPVSSWSWFTEDVKMSDQSDANMVLSVKREHHQKKIICTAENKAGSGEISTKLAVTYGPIFKTPDDYVSADPGDTVELNCLVDSNPQSSIVWTKKGSVDTLGRESKLLIDAVAEYEFGTYTCTAMLAGFQYISQDFQLVKKGPPSIASASEQSARYGEVGVIDCIIKAMPKPTVVTWYKENKSLNFSTLPRYKLREEDTKDGRHSIIEISNIQDGDFGFYNCSAENSYGQAQMAIEFYKRAMLPIPYILAAVLSGVLLLIIILVAVFVYRRRRSMGSEKGSESSEFDFAKKKVHLPDIKLEYSNGTAFAEPPYGSPWKPDVIDFRPQTRFYTPPPIPSDSWAQPAYAAPMRYDPYISNPSIDPFTSVYGTYPRRPPPQSKSYRGDHYYGPEMFGTLREGQPPPRHTPQPYEYVRPPPSPANSRLSTNV